MFNFDGLFMILLEVVERTRVLLIRWEIQFVLVQSNQTKFIWRAANY